MTVDLLSRLGATEAESVRNQIRESHAGLPKEKCMAWLHARRFPSKEGGCDIHKAE